MRFLIIGASGLVGGNCLKYLEAQEDVEVLGTHFTFATDETYFFDTLDMENPYNYDLQDFKPTHILHAGALTHVDYCEENPEESYRQTVKSTINILEVAEAFSAKVIYVSTDYVFDGKNGPYDENAEVNPVNTYGKHKLEAENLVRQASGNNLILRITNVYGDEIRGKNFVSRLWNAAINNEELTLRLPYDQFATPVNALDIAKCLYILCSDQRSGVYNIAGTDYLNRIQLANKVLKYFNRTKINITPLPTSALNQPAKRPLDGGLKMKKFISEYPDFQMSSVDDFLSAMNG